MAEQARGRRGPKANPDRGEPIGYRVTARTRFELQMAAAFIGTTSHQETIEVAVQEFLDRLRSDTVGFSAALVDAEASQRDRAGVRPLDRPDT